jgi:putative transposase
MNYWLDECRWLYNHFLDERIKTYKETKTNLTFNDQALSLSNLKRERYMLADIYSQVLIDVAKRVDKSFRNFFRKIKAKEKPGFPQFQGKDRYNSFTFTQYGFKITENEKLHLSKIGDIKIVLHRPIEGVIKTCTIKRSYTNKWYVSFACNCESIPLQKNNNVVNIDIGLNSFSPILNIDHTVEPEVFRQDQKALDKARYKWSKSSKKSPERAKCRKVVARIQERIKFRRQNSCHQVSRYLINNFDNIVVENLNIEKKIPNHYTAKAIQDAAWPDLFRQLEYKAEWADRKLIVVDQSCIFHTCPKCGHKQELKLKERVYICQNCSQPIDLDHNAAANILKLGQYLQDHPDCQMITS